MWNTIDALKWTHSWCICHSTSKSPWDNSNDGEVLTIGWCQRNQWSSWVHTKTACTYHLTSYGKVKKGIMKSNSFVSYLVWNLGWRIYIRECWALFVWHRANHGFIQHIRCVTTFNKWKKCSVICQYVCQSILFVQPIRSLICFVC